MADFNNKNGRKQGGRGKFDGKPFGGKFGDKPGYDRRGDKPFGSKPYGERKFGDKPGFDRGERKFGDKPYGERKFGDKPGFDRGERKFGDKPYGERKFGDKPGFDRGERRFDRRPDFDRRNEMPEERPQAPEELPNIIMGRNPVKEAIKSGRSIDRILVTKEHDGSLGEIIGLAKDRNLIIREVDRYKLDELCMPFGHDGKSGNHQGIVAEIPGVEYSELSDILAYAEEKGEKPFVILLDGIEDPHNLGSIIRSAECAGAHGVVIPKRRSAPVTAAVVKTSAGAAEHMRIARVVNIVSAMEQLKAAGLWIAGADMAGRSMHETDMKGAFALVVGGEGDGLSKLVREKCDFLVSIPLKGSIDSLNAAVAAAIIMFEKNRQDGLSE